ncbi:MAG: 2'-5' RNA ligase family protein [Steroidobacteraceae bacterium]
MAPEEVPPRDAPRREPTLRLFFALWPDEQMRQTLADAARKAARAGGGRPVAMGNLHVTLAFLGSVPERRLGELAEVARAAAPGPAFAGVGAQSPVGESAFPAGSLELTFDHLEYWRAAELLCALPAEPPAPIAALARRLRDRLAASGFAPDLKPFRPHVTVVRKVVRPGAASKMHPVVWRFTELALIESRTLPAGALYSVVEAFSLCSGRKTANNTETP